MKIRLIYVLTAIFFLNLILNTITLLAERVHPPRKHICGKSIQVANDHPATGGCTLAKSRLYEVKQLTSGILLVDVKVHLIPPGSTKIAEQVSLDEIKKQKNQELFNDAMKSVKFFEERLDRSLREKAEQKKLILKSAMFDLYQDMMGRKFTDLLFIEFLWK
jgi:hypothetical protein